LVSQEFESIRNRV